VLTQWLLVLAAASVASAYLGRQAWRSWSGGCGKGCGCSSAPRQGPALISADDLISRVKARRPG
jgi:hypothetical protein